jgi:hypothetical protein
MREKDSEQEHRREGNATTLRELVTVQSFRLPSEAMLAKAMLDSAGIECVLADDNAARILGFASEVIGGISVQVNRVDADAAKALLHQPLADAFDGAGEANEELRCPKCYSGDVTCREIDKPMTYSGAWLSDPLPIHAKVCTCNSCSYEWDDEDSTLDG